MSFSLQQKDSRLASGSFLSHFYDLLRDRFLILSLSETLHVVTQGGVIPQFLLKARSFSGLTFPTVETHSKTTCTHFCLYESTFTETPAATWQERKEHKPADGGWRVSCDDEQSAHLQHWRSDHCHSHTGRPNVFDCKKNKAITLSESNNVWNKWLASLDQIKLIYPRTNCEAVCPEQALNPACFSLSPSWVWVSISDSGLSLEGELDDDENEGVDSHSSLSDSVISPSSGSLFPSESSLRAVLFFFFCFFDLVFLLFFLDLPLSSQCDPFFCFFLFDEDLSLSSRCLEESFLRGVTSGLRDLRFSFRDSVVLLIVCRSTHSVSSSSAIFTSSNTSSCHQTGNSEITISITVHWQRASWLCRSHVWHCFCTWFQSSKTIHYRPPNYRMNREIYTDLDITLYPDF